MLQFSLKLLISFSYGHASVGFQLDGKDILVVFGGSKSVMTTASQPPLRATQPSPYNSATYAIHFGIKELCCDPS